MNVKFFRISLHWSLTIKTKSCFWNYSIFWILVKAFSWKVSVFFYYHQFSDIWYENMNFGFDNFDNSEIQLVKKWHRIMEIASINYQRLISCQYLFGVCRYSAVCRPVSYRASTIVNTATHRVTMWVAGATLLSCVVNAPRFFETKLVWKSFSTTSASNHSEPLHKLSFEVTNMRRDPNYIRYDQNIISWVKSI